MSAKLINVAHRLPLVGKRAGCTIARMWMDRGSQDRMDHREDWLHHAHMFHHMGVYQVGFATGLSQGRQGDMIVECKSPLFVSNFSLASSPITHLSLPALAPHSRVAFLALTNPPNLSSLLPDQHQWPSRCPAMSAPLPPRCAGVTALCAPRQERPRAPARPHPTLPSCS